jgi:hypothetical protein
VEDQESVRLDVARSARLRLEGLQVRLDELAEQRARCDALIKCLTEEAGHLRALLSVYGESTTPADHPLEVDRTASLADRVVELLKSEARPMHYREIEAALRARGTYTGAGKDPANALLAQFFSDIRLYRTARGTYALAEGQERKSVGVKGKRRGRNRG